MPDSKKTQSDNSNQQAGKLPGDDKKSVSTTIVAKPLKEHEPKTQNETFGQIQEISKEADVNAERELKYALGEEARLAQVEPKLGPDLEDHGVVSPAAGQAMLLKMAVLSISQ